ncbi:MAG: hypothetical protein HYX27_17350 [Acidobacteria bacterium]|nr:hypothetical protein [Acidobacteriota bacterium]
MYRRTQLGLCLTCVIAAWAQGNSGNVRDLNNKVLQLHAAIDKTPPGQAEQVRGQAAVVLKQRAAALTALIKENPAAAIGLSFSADLLSDLADKFPASASSLEQHGAWSGTSDHVIFDDPARSVRAAEVRIKTAQGILQVFSASGEPHCVSGNTLNVSGVRLDNVVAAGSTSVQTGVAAAGTACSTQGTQNTAVLLVQFPGVALPTSVTVSNVWDIFFASSGRSVSGYWNEASYGKASAAGNVFGPYTLDRVYTCDEYSSMRSAAIAAADSDVNFLNYNRVFIVFPNSGSCAWAGLGSLGCGTLTSADGSFQASTSWLLADYMNTRDNGVRLAAHEGGHNLTMHHASTRDFGAETLGPVGTAGSLNEYGDVFNTMGSWNFGHYNAPHKAMIGWLNSSNILTTESNGSYSVLPLATPAAGVQALKIRRGTGNNAWLWVEYRQPVGTYESTLSSQVFTGGLIHYEDATTGTHTHLLDYTKTTSSYGDPALAGSWADPYTNLSLSISGAGSAALSVTANYGPVPCVTAAPSVSISPANPTVQSGNSVNYTVAVTNMDTGGCANRTYSLASTLPALIASSLSPSALTLTPGQAANSTMTKTIPAGFTPATYAVNATASDGLNSTSATANMTVIAPPEPLYVSLTTSATNIAVRTTVALRATVSTAAGPSAGASVTFKAVRSNGVATTYTTTSNTSGVAAWDFRPQQKDTFTITATASKSGAAATSNSVAVTAK